MSAARIDQSAQVALAAHVRLQLGAIEQAHRLVAVLIVQFLIPVAKFLKMPRFGGDVHVIGPVVAVDRMLANQCSSDIERFDRQLEQAARVGRAYLRGEGFLAHREAEDSLSAAASRCAVADEARFQQATL